MSPRGACVCARARATLALNAIVPVRHGLSRGPSGVREGAPSWWGEGVAATGQVQSDTTCDRRRARAQDNSQSALSLCFWLNSAGEVSTFWHSTCTHYVKRIVVGPGRLFAQARWGARGHRDEGPVPTPSQMKANLPVIIMCNSGQTDSQFSCGMHKCVTEQVSHFWNYISFLCPNLVQNGYFGTADVANADDPSALVNAEQVWKVGAGRGCPGRSG